MKIDIENKWHGASGTEVKYPYFSPPQDVYDFMTRDLSLEGKRAFANAVAHHMIPVQKVDEGWLMTRSDHSAEEIISLITNEGKWIYLRKEPKENT